MLRSLHIRNYILIDSLDISFPEGLIIITGQTGAGKSIIIGALSLLSGTKADASMISAGADSCVVEGVFDAADDTISSLLKEEDIEFGGDLIIRRVISSSGRSRCFVNDCPVQVGLLQSISERLIDVHSQHKSLLLTDHNFQLSVFDHFAGNDDRLVSCRKEWKKLQGLRSEIASLKEKMQHLDADREYNAAQFRQLDEAKLQSGELESLEEEHSSLANAEEIKEALSRVLEVFSPEGDEPGVVESLKEAAHQLDRISEFLPSVTELSARLETSRIELDDISSEVEKLFSRVDVSPEHLETIEDRMSKLYSLLKKHDCSNVDELIAVRDRFKETLSDSSSLEDELIDLESSESAVSRAYDAICAELSAARRKAAGGFSSSIMDSLHFLELDRSVFDVGIEQAEPGPEGRDRINYLFDANGVSPVDVARCASGGEISRIMLCLKAMMAKFVGMPTLIFDEIDTGVSGSVADKMGQMICDMGRDMQVFSITHLPQVAAKGKEHYVVTKENVPDGRVVTSIHKVEGKARVNEIARLLSGAKITEAAVANAESLLNGR